GTFNMRNDRLHLTVGGRYTTDQKDGLLFMVNNAPTNFTFATDDSHFDPLVTLAWTANKNVNLYGKVSTGYRSGGASSRSLTYRSFGPEDVDAYEIGIKTELFDRNERLNAAVFQLTRTGRQLDINRVT